MPLSSNLLNDLSLESQFVSLLTESEEIIKATTPNSSENVVLDSTAVLLHLFPEAGSLHPTSANRA